MKADDILDAKMLAEAVEKDETRRPLKELAWAMQKASGKVFEEWNDLRDAEYDDL